MSKKIIDNATFYRMLDSLGTDKEKEMFDNLFSATLNEQLANSTELKKAKESLLEFLSNTETPYNNHEFIKLLIKIELLINGLNGIKSNNKTMEIFYTREQFVYGLITEEEKNERIKNLLKNDYYKRMELEYQCTMYELLEIEDVESDEYQKQLDRIIQFKKRTLELKEAPKVNYPTTDDSQAKKKLATLKENI